MVRTVLVLLALAPASALACGMPHRPMVAQAEAPRLVNAEPGADLDALMRAIDASVAPPKEPTQAPEPPPVIAEATPAQPQS